MNSLLHFLAGTWFVCSTTFPMWTNGRNTHPEFRYTITQKNGREVLYDEVLYTRNGRSKTIRGYDRPDRSDSTAFTWRGKGLLGLLKSRWRVALSDPQGKWVVIAFSKTLFTPEGMDILFRDPSPDPAILTDIRHQLDAFPDLSRHLMNLKELPPD